MLSTSLEMKTLHPWTQQSTWQRFLQVSVLLTHCNDLCTYLWLHSGGCLCFWQNASIVCAHVKVYWQLAPCYAPVLSLPASGLNNTERRASLLWRRFARQYNSLFLLFKKQHQQCIVLWQQLLKAFASSHQHRIGHWLCGQCERILWDCCTLTFFRDNRKANNTCHLI